MTDTLATIIPPLAGRDIARETNKVAPGDRAVHDWYRFVLSFPPHLVGDYLSRFGATADSRVLDPFCGTGTTVVECKKRGIPSVGIEINPVAQFAGAVKTDWTPDPDGLLEHADAIAAIALAELRAQGIADNPLRDAWGEPPTLPAHLRILPTEAWELLLKNSISPLPLHKTLILLDAMNGTATTAITVMNCLPSRKRCPSPSVTCVSAPKSDWARSRRTCRSLAPGTRASARLRTTFARSRLLSSVPTVVHHADARSMLDVLEPASIDIVITSPPYPNEKDYTRTTRLESVLLGFINNKEELRALKRGLVRSNTRGVYKGDDDDLWVADHPEIQRIAAAIEARRIELGKTSGFERLYARVTKLYFGGMARHLADLRTVLRPGAHLAYVVGDQASYLRVMIRTGQILADIGQSLGYEVVGIDLFRTRIATATKEQLREEVVVLRWPGMPTSASGKP